LANRIQLCGRLVVELEGRRLEEELPARQGRVLFAYLAANRDRPCGRGELVEAVWPHDLPPHPESALNALISKLRRALGPKLLEGRSTVQLRLPAGTWIDLEAAGEAIHRAESAVGYQDWAGAWGSGQVAQYIAKRGFLPGEDGPWIDEIRQRLEAIYLRSLEARARAGLGLGGVELDTAERSARSLIAASPYHESGYRLLMAVLAERDNAAEALHVYERLREILRDELGTVPGSATQDVHRRLLG
jgi:SARP family transcriptional regulator, regulator of embCAB operon